MFDTPLNHFKSVFTHNFLIAPADNNYLLARFCRIYGVYDDFWWQAAQALEKYLKAGIVLNGHSSIEFRHDLVALYSKHRDVFKDSAFLEFSKPDNLADSHWRLEPVEKFISKVSRIGDPDSRYGQVSRFEKVDDLFKLDQIVHELRRRTIGLDWIIGADFSVPEYEHLVGLRYSDAIAQDSSFHPRDLKINDFPLNIAGDKVSDIIYSWNFSLARDSSDLSKAAPRTVIPSISMKNSYLFLIYEDLKSMPAVTEDVREKVESVLSSFFFDKETKKSIRYFLDK
jgi:hypothetical protein